MMNKMHDYHEQMIWRNVCKCGHLETYHEYPSLFRFLFGLKRLDCSICKCPKFRLAFTKDYIKKDTRLEWNDIEISNICNCGDNDKYSHAVWCNVNKIEHDTK